MNNNNNNTTEYLQQIQNTEGEGFVFDQNGIDNEYARINNEKSTLGIKLLSVLGGFLATLAFLGFIFITISPTETTLAVLGFTFIAAAIALNIKYDKLLTDTLSVSTYTIGFFLIAFGLSDINENLTSVLFIAIAVIALLATQNYVLAFISTVIVGGCLFFLVVNNDYYNAIHLLNGTAIVALCYTFLREAKLIGGHRKISDLYYPVRTALFALTLAGLSLIGKRGLLTDNYLSYIWLLSAVTIPAIMYMVSLILARIGVTNKKQQRVIYALTAVFMLSTVLMPSISGALVVLLLCFWGNYKTGLAVSIVSFIYFVGQYYYDLNLSLLTKSIVLFASGVAFLLLYISAHKHLTVKE